MNGKLYITKQEYGRASTFIYRIISENGNGVFTFAPSITKRTKKRVPLKAMSRNIIHARLKEMIEL